jgi:hypothetical protein
VSEHLAEQLNACPTRCLDHELNYQLDHQLNLCNSLHNVPIICISPATRQRLT